MVTLFGLVYNLSSIPIQWAITDITELNIEANGSISYYLSWPIVFPSGVFFRSGMKHSGGLYSVVASISSAANGPNNSRMLDYIIYVFNVIDTPIVNGSIRVMTMCLGY